jgi:predicted nucleic acid-binding protein
VKVYVEEAGSASVREQVGDAIVVATSSITYVEARTALARRRRAGDLAAGEHRRLVGELDSDWDRYIRLEVSSALIREAAALADRYPLRAYDAIHLAAAVTARRRLGNDLVFACWDDTLSAAASREGLALARR